MIPIILRVPFVTAASGFLAYMNTMQQIPDSTDRLVASAAIGVGTMVIGEAAGAVGELAGLAAIKLKTGYSWGETTFAAAFSGGHSPQAKWAARGALPALLLGLYLGFNLASGYFTPKFAGPAPAQPAAGAQVKAPATAARFVIPGMQRG